jgi:hypothetical protein
MMIEYVRWLSHRCGCNPLFIVLDLSSAHRVERFRECARVLSVRLDRRIFRKIKARARAELRQGAWEIGSIGVSPADAVEILVKAWDLISAECPQSLESAMLGNRPDSVNW